MAIDPRVVASMSLAAAVERPMAVSSHKDVPATMGSGAGDLRRFSSSASLSSMRAKSIPEDLASILEVSGLRQTPRPAPLQCPLPHTMHGFPVHAPQLAAGYRGRRSRDNKVGLLGVYRAFLDSCNAPCAT